MVKVADSQRWNGLSHPSRGRCTQVPCLGASPGFGVTECGGPLGIAANRDHASPDGSFPASHPPTAGFRNIWGTTQAKPHRDKTRTSRLAFHEPNTGSGRMRKPPGRPKGTSVHLRDSSISACVFQTTLPAEILPSSGVEDEGAAANRRDRVDKIGRAHV